jgi:hypothetical protein
MKKGRQFLNTGVVASGGTKKNSQRSYLGINWHSVLTFSGHIG